MAVCTPKQKGANSLIFSQNKEKKTFTFLLKTPKLLLFSVKGGHEAQMTLKTFFTTLIRRPFGICELKMVDFTWLTEKKCRTKLNSDEKRLLRVLKEIETINCCLNFAGYINLAEKEHFL